MIYFICFRLFESRGHKCNCLQGSELKGVKIRECSSTLATSCKELTHGKDSDAGRDWGQEEKGTTEDEMAGWHH